MCQFSCCEFCSRLEIVGFAGLWLIMRHFDKNDNNYLNESDDFHFFNFNLILLPPFLLQLEAWNRWIILVCIFLLWVLLSIGNCCFCWIVMNYAPLWCTTFINVQVVFQTFRLAVMVKVRGIFFWLLVTVMSICTTLIWVIKTTFLTVFSFLVKYQSD